MNILYILSLLFSASPGLAAEEAYRSYSSQDKAYQSVSIVDFQGIKISKSCLKKKEPDCKAFRAVKNRVVRSSSPTPLLGNPAARYCLDQGASNRIFLNSKEQEFDFCFFSDGSSVDAWSLYNKHYGKR